MMEPVLRIRENSADPVRGQIRLDYTKVLWTGGMTVLGFGLTPFFTNLSAVILGLASTYFTLLLGHSVGMHRMMIHRSFHAQKWLRYSLLYLGTLVGIGGPSSVIRIHDIRDWAQRAPDCHDYFSHNRSFWRDITWQLFYKFEFENTPEVEIEPEVSQDAFLKHLDKYWRLHQILLAIAIYFIGGLPFVVWGVFLRVSISTIGHWTVTFVCHNPGPGKWDVRGAGVQASNLQLNGWIGGILTHGECWHNNHHAFPESAKIGVYRNQFDPAWIVISIFQKIGLVTRVSMPREAIEDLSERAPLPNS